MRRGLACLLLLVPFVPLVRTQDPVQGLLAADWRQRNAAARTLAVAPALDVDALLKVMQTPEDDWVSDGSIYSGVGGGRGPIAAIVLECQQEAGEHVLPLKRHDDSFPLREPNDLVIPRSPATLAAWLLERHPALRETIRSRWQALQIEPTNLPLARMWLSVLTPSIDEVLAAATREPSRHDVLQACARLQPETLRIVILRSDLPIQAAGLLVSAGLDKNRITALDDEQLRATLASCFLRAADDVDAARLGRALRAHGIAGLSAALTAGRDDMTARRRITALAVTLTETTAVPIGALTPFLTDDDPRVVERALCALRRPERDAQAARDLAPLLFELLDDTRDPRRATVALYALAGIGPDVPADLAERAKTFWDKLPWPGSRPALLLAMSRLSVDAKVPLAAKVAALSEPGATQANRDELYATLAGQDDGGAASLLALRPRPTAWLLHGVASAAAKQGPARLHAWLTEPRLRLPALNAIAAAVPERLPPYSELQAMATGSSKEAQRDLLDVLARHADATSHLEELLPTILEVAWHEGGSLGEFLRAHHRSLPPDRRVELLNEPLSRGDGWWLVQDATAESVLPRLRAWFDQCKEDHVRDRLCAQIARFGATDDHDRIMSQLASERADWVLGALRAVPLLAEPLHSAVERHIDSQLLEPPHRTLGAAFEVLWAHRQR